MKFKNQIGEKWWLGDNLSNRRKCQFRDGNHYTSTTSKGLQLLAIFRIQHLVQSYIQTILGGKNQGNFTI
jgi:hypothetical protein